MDGRTTMSTLGGPLLFVQIQVSLSPWGDGDAVFCNLRRQEHKVLGSHSGAGQPHPCGWMEWSTACKRSCFASKVLSRFNKLIECFVWQTPIEKAFWTTSTMDRWIRILCLQIYKDQQFVMYVKWLLRDQPHRERIGECKSQREKIEREIHCIN